MPLFLWVLSLGGDPDLLSCVPGSVTFTLPRVRRCLLFGYLPGESPGLNFSQCGPLGPLYQPDPRPPEISPVEVARVPAPLAGGQDPVEDPRGVEREGVLPRWLGVNDALG